MELKLGDFVELDGIFLYSGIGIIIAISLKSEYKYAVYWIEQNVEFIYRSSSLKLHKNATKLTKLLTKV